MAIKDREIRDALENIEIEVENLEEQIVDKDKEIAELQAKVVSLEDRVEVYQERITELEDALAESYLTSETDDGVQREDADVQPGLGTDVLDSANDETIL